MRVHYTVSLKEPQKKYYHVTLVLSGLDQSSVSLHFPTWTPGSYLIRDFAKDLSHFSAHGERGQALKWQKVSKSEWQVSAAGNASISVSYRIYGGEVSVHGTYLDHRYGFFNSPAMFFYGPGWEGLPVSISLILPPKWSVATGLRELSPHRYRAESMDELFDSPFQMGREQKIHRFRARGKTHTVAFVGEILKDPKQMVKDIARLVNAEISLFREAPYRDYTFLVQFVPGRYGGLEHSNSSANLFDPWQLIDGDKYSGFLSLISHEFFHTWNVKRIRPRGLGPFDYGKEVYTRELWLAEGATAYYDDHFLVRSGLLSREDYLSKVLTTNLARYEESPAKSVMSLSESSFDAWIKLYRPNDNTINTTMSYYLKGGLVMMLLDMEIIRLSEGRHTLDDVMRRLWALFKEHPEEGISRDDFDRAVFATVPNAGLQRFLKTTIDTPTPIPWLRFLRPFGFFLKEKKNGKPPRLGVKLVERNHALILDKVLDDSPAADSALQAGDEILAVDGLRVQTEKELKNFLALKKSSDSMRLLFSRQGKVEEAALVLAPHGDFSFEVASRARLGRAEKKRQEVFFRRA